MLVNLQVFAHAFGQAFAAMVACALVPFVLAIGWILLCCRPIQCRIWQPCLFKSVTAIRLINVVCVLLWFLWAYYPSLVIECFSTRLCLYLVLVCYLVSLPSYILVSQVPPNYGTEHNLKRRALIQENLLSYLWRIRSWGPFGLLYLPAIGIPTVT